MKCGAVLRLLAFKRAIYVVACFPRRGRSTTATGEGTRTSRLVERRVKQCEISRCRWRMARKHGNPKTFVKVPMLPQVLALSVARSVAVARGNDMRTVLSSVLVVLVLTPRVMAQGREVDGTPDAVVVSSFRAQRDRDWRALILLAHSDAVEEFKSEVVRSMTTLRSFRGVPNNEGTLHILPFFFGVETLDELIALDSDTLVERFLACTREIHGASADYRLPRILGHVLDGDSVAYVLVRWDKDQPAEQSESLPGMRERGDRVDLVTLKRDNRGRWRTMLDGGLVYGRSGFVLDFA